MKKLFITSFAALMIISCGKRETEYPSNVPQTGEIPILGWHSIPGDHTSDKAYQEMRAAGFTHSYTNFRDGNGYLKSALDAAGKAGIKIFLRANDLTSDSRREALVREYMSHPALAGWFLWDEPTNKDIFDQMAAWRESIAAVDNAHVYYANLLPDLTPSNSALYQNMGLTDYEGYLDYYIQKLRPSFLSYAYYPIVKDLTGKTILYEDSWFPSLEKVSAKAQRARIPFWTFALSTAHTPLHDPNRPNPSHYDEHFPVPTIEHLRIQMWNNLAYGAQALQYFTYWTPARDEDVNFWYGGGPKESDGTTGPAYNVVAAMNREIQALNGVFGGCTMRWVRHTGDKIPAGTRPLTELPAGVKRLETTGKGATVSLIENQGFTFLVIVSRSIDEDVSVSMEPASNKVKRVMKDASIVELSGDGKYTVPPGDILIFALERPAL